MFNVLYPSLSTKNVSWIVLFLHFIEKNCLWLILLRIQTSRWQFWFLLKGRDRFPLFYFELRKAKSTISRSSPLIFSRGGDFWRETKKFQKLASSSIFPFHLLRGTEEGSMKTSYKWWHNVLTDSLNDNDDDDRWRCTLELFIQQFRERKRDDVDGNDERERETW